MTEPLDARIEMLCKAWVTSVPVDILRGELDAARKASRGSGLDVERFQEAWRRAERAVNVGGHRLTPHDVAREYAALDPTP